MRQLYKLFALIGFVTSTTACYEDKGNYDYKDINEIVIDMNEDNSTRNISMGGTIEYNPTIKFVNGKGDLSRFDFKWVLIPSNDFPERPPYTQDDWNTLNFKWTPDMLVLPSGRIRIEATDRETGVVYYGSSYISVSARYDENGVMILAEKEGKTQFSFVKITGTSGLFPAAFESYDNVYNMENGSDLPAKPISMLEHFCADGTTIGQMFIYTETGAYDVNGQDFQKDVDFQEAFDGGVYPQDFGYVSSAMFMSHVDVVADAQGYLYSRIKNTSTLFHSGYFLHERLRVKGETEDLKGCKLYRAPFKDTKACLAYEVPKKRLLLVGDAGTGAFNGPQAENAGRPIALYSPADAPEGFLPLDNFGDAEILSISFIRSASIFTFGYSIIYYKEGKTFCQEFDINKEYYSFSFDTENFQVYEITGLPGKPTVICPSPYVEYNTLALYAVGNRLFVHDRGNPNTPVVEYIPKDKDGTALDVFTGDFVSMDAENYISRWATAGLSDGRMLMLRLETANYPEDQTVLYDSGPGVYGNIVDVRCKILSGADWYVNNDK